MGQPGPFSDEDVHSSATLDLLENFKVPLLPKFATDRLSERLVRWLARQPRPSHLFSFLERGGWYSAENFLAWLKGKLDAGTPSGNPRRFSHMTLKEFYAATRVDLSLVAADTTAGLMLVLNHRTAPGCPLVWAVRMSMSIPLLWQEVIWETGWGAYLGKSITGDAIVDGGLLSNFPIELFLSDLPSVTRVMGPPKGEHVLGMLIDETLTVKGAAQSPAKEGFDFGSLKAVQRIGNLVNTTIGARDKAVIETFNDLVVRLPAKGYGTTEFDMAEERKEKLVAAGRSAMRAYFNQQTAAARMPEAVPAWSEIANRRAKLIVSRKRLPAVPA
jgi:NTE family protein